MNKVILTGNLGRDPEVKFAPSGIAIATFSLATQERKKENGEWKKHTEWHNLISFGKTAESIGEYLKSGAKILIEGRLQTSTWEKDGIKHYKTEIIVDSFEFLDKKE